MSRKSPRLRIVQDGMGQLVPNRRFTRSSIFQEVGSSAAVFDPISLSPDGWWKSTDGVFADSSFETPATDTGDVNGWQDQGGKENHIFQTLAGRNLEYYDNETDNINGLPVVRCPGGLDYLFNNGLGRYQPDEPFSFFCVIRPDTVSGTDWFTSCQPNGWGFALSNGKPYFRFYDGSTFVQGLAASGVSADELCTVGFIWDGTADENAFTLYKNGSPLSVTPTGSSLVSITYTAFFNLGGYSAAGSNFDGDLPEAILVPSDISANIENLHTYFVDRYGIGA